ncbi:unnamed protein product, partial [Lampetra fluviatilis]
PSARPVALRVPLRVAGHRGHAGASWAPSPVAAVRCAPRDGGGHAEVGLAGPRLAGDGHSLGE